MKICLISVACYKLFHPEDERVLPFGGSEVQQYQLGKELSKDSDFEVSFIVGNFYKEQPKKEKWEDTINIYKAIKYYNRVFLIDTIRDFWNLYKAMKQISADVYMIRGGGSLAGIVAFLAKKVFRKKFIYSSAHNRDSNNEFLKNHKWYINYLFKYALKHTDTIVCQHIDQQDAFKRNLKIDANIISSMYSIGEYNKGEREYILWVSRLENWKQPWIFAKIATEFPTEKFILITVSNADELKKNTIDIKNLEIKEKIPFDEMDQYFKKAKVFINTSISEGFPNTFVQAGKNGTPIVSLNVNPGGMLEKYKIGICANGETVGLGVALKKLLENEDLWYIMSENAYKYTKEIHDIKEVVKVCKDLFVRIKSI